MNDLLRQIQEHVNKPQKSERWTMYRLIAPVVNFANSTLGFEGILRIKSNELAWNVSICRHSPPEWN
jgi:hypothetical protein